MFAKDQYELLDFGFGKKLERFSGIEVLRDCPAARQQSPVKRASLSPATSSARMVFEKHKLRWVEDASLPSSWRIGHREVVFNLKPTPFGHLGVFCEQAENWDWLVDLPFGLAGKRALNLFAYTGGSTLSLACRGAEVVHIDSAKNVVGWARSNAEESGLQNANIRWIVDDVIKFVRREIKRGNKYDVIVADPPAIGHASKKLTWKFERDFELLLELLSQIVSEDFLALLLTCHTEGCDSNAVSKMSRKHFELQQGSQEHGPLDLVCRDGRRLNCGHYFRWHQ